MKKRILYTLAAASLLAAAGSVTAASLQESGSFSTNVAPKTEGTEEELTPEEPTLTGVCNLEGRELYIHLTVKAPKQARNSDYTLVDVAKFTKLSLYREADNWSDPAILLQEWTDVDADAEFTCDDKDPALVKGKEYTYYAVATLGTTESYKNKDYVTFGITPVTPDPAVLEPTGIVAPVTVKYTCPALEQQISYWETAPMPEGVTYEKIVLSRSFNGEVTELESHDNPTPGQEFTFVDNDAQNGSNTYMVHTVTFVGNSDTSSKNIWLGYDYPASPSNVTAVEVDGKVKVTWDAPTRGWNYGELNTETLRYSVYRMKSSYDPEPKLLAEDVAVCEYIDDIADLTAEQTVYYRIKPRTDVEAPEGTYNYADTYTGIVVGPPAQLPFHETFNAGSKFDKKTDNLWQEEFAWDSFNDHYLRYDQTVTFGDTEMKMPAGVDGGTMEDELGPDAFLYVTAASYYENFGEGYYTSGKLTLANATNPYASFYIVPINNNTGTVSLQVWKGDADENGNPVWENVHTVSCDDPELDESAVTTELKWTKVMFPMTAYAGAELCKLRFVFKYAEPKEARYPILFDEISIEDYPAPTDLAVARADNGDLNVTWALPESAGEKAVEYNVYLDGEKVATTTEASYTHTAVEQGESYTFEVEAVYADGITTAKTEPVTYDVELTSFTVDDITYYVNGEDVTALRYEGTAESVTIPANVEYKGLSFNVTDMSVSLFKGNRTLKSVTIEAPLTVIPVESFYGCVELSEVTIPASVTKIDEKTFFGCAKLEAITMPDALTTIGASAFEHSGLTSISFGENLTAIGAGAFRYCAALAEVTFATAVPPTVGEEAFADIADPCWGGCPSSSIEAYQAEPNLSTITFRMAGVNGINSGNNVVRTDYFNAAGERIAAPQQGVVTIVRTTYADGKVTTKKILNK